MTFLVRCALTWVIPVMVFQSMVACNPVVHDGEGGGGMETGSGTVPDLGPCTVEASVNAAASDTFTPDASNDPGCPNEPGPGTCAGADVVCYYDVPCQSGGDTFGYDCTDGKPVAGFGEQACDLVHDTCPSLELTCGPTTDGGLVYVPATGTDLPPLCPWDRPAEGSACTTGYYGGARCGYWCGADAQTWTIAECKHLEGKTEHSFDGYWDFDDACACAAE